MRLKYDFVAREIAGDYVLVPQQDAALKLCALLTTNDVGAFLVELLKFDTTVDTLTERLMEEFEVDAVTAEKDVADFVDQLQKLDLVE